MTVFGPRYARFPRLQRAVNHAERAWGLLVEIDDAIGDLRDENSPEVEGEDLRFCGRASELLVHVSATIEAWRQGSTDREAECAIESFLQDHVHGLLRTRFGIEPECCADCEERTVARAIAFLEEPTVAGTFAQVLAVSSPDRQELTRIGRDHHAADAVVRFSAWTDKQRNERP